MKKLCSSLIRSRLASVPKRPQAAELAPCGGLEVKISISELSNEFLPWYIRFLINELRPTTPYQGHITALSVLFSLCEVHSDFLKLAETGETDSNDPVENFRLHHQLSRTLLDLLFNPFDDVRLISASILENLVSAEFCQRSLVNKQTYSKRINSSLTSKSIVHNILGSLPRAEALFKKTGRADHADGLGRLLSLAFGARRFSSANYGQSSAYKLIEYELEQGIDIAIDNLERAVDTSPLHGYLTALRQVNLM